MKLSRRIDKILIALVVITLGVVFGCLYNVYSRANSYAEGESSVYEGAAAKFVTFYDGGEKLTVRTEARTVGEALSRAEIIVNGWGITACRARRGSRQSSRR